MGQHDKYGKVLLTRAFGSNFDSRPKRQYLHHGGRDAGSINIDGVLFGAIAVEVESRVNKQVRGAILDLILHPMKLKLLVLIQAHGNDYTENQARYILSQFCDVASCRVVCIRGSGDRPDEYLATDVEVLRAVVRDLHPLAIF